VAVSGGPQRDPSRMEEWRLVVWRRLRLQWRPLSTKRGGVRRASTQLGTYSNDASTISAMMAGIVEDLLVENPPSQSSTESFHTMMQMERVAR